MKQQELADILYSDNPSQEDLDRVEAHYASEKKEMEPLSGMTLVVISLLIGAVYAWFFAAHTFLSLVMIASWLVACWMITVAKRQEEEVFMYAIAVSSAVPIVYGFVLAAGLYFGKM